MADTEDIRDALLTWAAASGVLAASAQRDAGSRSGKISLVPFTAEHAEYFRTRNIVRVQADSAGATPVLSVFTRLKLAEKKKAILTGLFDDLYRSSGLQLKFDISKPYKVDQAVQTYGRFEPIHKDGKRFACGSSIGIGNQRNAGTLTALARRTDNQEILYGLSCNHVVGGCSTALPGTPIVIPRIQDVSPDHAEITVIGQHESAASMSQGLPSVRDITVNFDLACFQISRTRAVSSMQGSGAGRYDTPTQFVANAERGMAVKKWGRSTQLTTGVVSNVIDSGAPVDYNVTSYYGPMNSQTFKGTVYFSKLYEITPTGGPFSLGGDSGALVVTNDGNDEHVVGIVVAGAREMSMVLPLEPMLADLSLELVSDYPTSKSR